VTKRTIERDLEELARIVPIDRNEVSIPYGWHWLENARFETLGMDLSEAVSLGLMEDLLRQIMPHAFLSAPPCRKSRTLAGRISSATCRRACHSFRRP
jgi:hypothetical protein